MKVVGGGKSNDTHKMNGKNGHGFYWDKLLLLSDVQ